MRSIERRLHRLTRRRLCVLYRVDGTEHKGSVGDLIQDNGEFVKVLHGSDPADLDALLNHIIKE